MEICDLPSYETLIKNHQQQNKSYAECSLVSGIFVSGSIRCFLNECICKGLDITFSEKKRWFENRFTISGDKTDVKDVIYSIRRRFVR